MNNQVWQVRYLIPEFYSAATDFIVDEVEERVYFECEGEMQVCIDREQEEVVFQYQEGEDWHLADTASFEEVNERNEAPIF